MRRAVLTGATGAVGTALVRELAEHDIEVLVLCREGSPRNRQIPRHPLVTVRYCSLDRLSTVCNDTGKPFDAFFHLAWEGTTGQARNDLLLQNQNVRYALDAVGAAMRFGCHRFIGAGSQAEYGRVEGMLRPDTPAFPETGYGIAKLCAGQMTRIYARQLGMAHHWIRMLSIYGPNDGAQSVMMSTLHELKNGGIPQLTKGEQMWDFLYSGDAARALRLVGEKGMDGKVYVLGSGVARPLADSMAELRDTVAPGRALGLGALPYREGQVMYLCADTSDLQRDTGWKPEVPFAEGIRKTWSEML